MSYDRDGGTDLAKKAELEGQASSRQFGLLEELNALKRKHAEERISQIDEVKGLIKDLGAELSLLIFDRDVVRKCGFTDLEMPDQMSAQDTHVAPQNLEPVGPQSESESQDAPSQPIQKPVLPETDPVPDILPTPEPEIIDQQSTTFSATPEEAPQTPEAVSESKTLSASKAKATGELMAQRIVHARPFAKNKKKK